MFNSYTVNTLCYDPDACTACGMCGEVCPHGVFATGGRRAELVRPQDCMECGACQLNCPAGAIQVDSGVGCATSMIWAALRGRSEVACG